MRIEFFHDAICSFCFPMSARMRRIAAKYPEIEIVHRSFALGWEERDFIRMFGSRAAVKPEVLSHWAHANENDDEHRFQIEGMRKQRFDFPLSRPALIAAKAAGILGGEGAYWDAFDRIQHKLFVENKNVEDYAVLEEAIRETDLDFAKWQALFLDPATEQKVLDDIQMAREYGVHSVPTLVINGNHVVSGALKQDKLEALIERYLREEKESEMV